MKIKRLRVLSVVVNAIATLFSFAQISSAGLDASTLPVWLESYLPVAASGVASDVPDPNQRTRIGVLRVADLSIAEGLRLSHKAVELQRSGDRHVESVKACNRDVLRALAETGDPNAEYLVGWICQHTSFSQQHVDYAEKWYKRASSHGSAAAYDELGSIYDMRNGQLRLLAEPCYKKAIAGGDTKAKLDLGVFYEAQMRADDSASSDAQNGASSYSHKAMALFEEAARSKNGEIVDDATHHVIWLWENKRATPSFAFCRGASNAYEYVLKYGSFWDADFLANRYIADGAGLNSEKVAELTRISKVRYALATEDPRMKHSVDIWNSRRTTAYTIGKSWSSFF